MRSSLRCSATGLTAFRLWYASADSIACMRYYHVARRLANSTIRIEGSVPRRSLHCCSIREGELLWSPAGVWIRA
ncbi:hypothetical protein BD626DRAFT_476129 [Schizophyllum amplum]|uniref:Uncharacterized protein n=1 Tax=Schizophyllum amplum TaxID=97359 RepID=A0A550CZ20_9AGAR|nr:hypothetical protein BD626DRAFT_476129 [Auriculariopsis ampla]